jgi:hypothetical protein
VRRRRPAQGGYEKCADLIFGSAGDVVAGFAGLR